MPRLAGSHRIVIEAIYEIRLRDIAVLEDDLGTLLKQTDAVLFDGKHRPVKALAPLHGCARLNLHLLPRESSKIVHTKQRTIEPGRADLESVFTSGTDLEDGLKWIEAAIAGQFFSEENFNNINIKAGILQRLGRNAEAVQTLEAYMPKASVLEMHQIGRRFIAMDMAEEALEVFKKNAQQHPDTWPTDYGLARGYSAMGDYKKALEHILIAKERAPDQPNRNAIAVNVEKLKKGQDIN